MLCIQTTITKEFIALSLLINIIFILYYYLTLLLFLLFNVYLILLIKITYETDWIYYMYMFRHNKMLRDIFRNI